MRWEDDCLWLCSLAKRLRPHRAYMPLLAPIGARSVGGGGRGILCHERTATFWSSRTWSWSKPEILVGRRPALWMVCWALILGLSLLRARTCSTPHLLRLTTPEESKRTEVQPYIPDKNVIFIYCIYLFAFLYSFIYVHIIYKFIHFFLYLFIYLPFNIEYC